jgi:tRNA nucleotidyltransferase/poly(A) polymerase
MGTEPKDYDLVTNALPSDIERILKGYYKLDLQGKHFAVIRVFTKETPEGVEIASYRKDIANGRDNKIDTNNPKVEYGNHITIKDDVLRRDLTCNGLYYDIKKDKIVDLVGGISDINNNIIKTIGNPIERFKEDRLRILRTFRLSAKNKFKIDKQTSDAIKFDNRLNGISPTDDVSQERIIDEFFKTLNWCKKNNDKISWKMYFNYLKEYDMFYNMFPNNNLNTTYYDTFNDIIIFAMLFSNNKSNEQLYNNLTYDIKLTNRITNSVMFLLKINELFNENNIQKLLDIDYKYNIVFLYKLKINIGIDNNTIKEFCILKGIKNEFIKSFINYKITTNAADLIKLGFKGKEIGNEIKRIEINKFIK